MRARRTLIALLVVAALALVSCGSDSDSGSSSATTVDLSGKTFADHTADDTVQVLAIDNLFKEPYIEVKAGTAVTFKNDGHNEHNVFPVVKGAFQPIETDNFAPGKEVTITFSKAGDVPYYCTLHGTPTKGMVGGVRVVEG